MESQESLTQEVLDVDPVTLVLSDVDPNAVTNDVIETIATTEPSTGVGVEEVVIPSGSEVSSAANSSTVMQSIIEALTNAASETAGLSVPSGESADGDGNASVEDPPPDESESQVTSSGEDAQEDPSSGIAAAAAALQALANKASTLSPTETITQLQQALQQSLQELPGAVASLVNEVASEVVVMAKAAQHATMAAESMIESQPEKIKKTKRGKLKLHKCSECGKGFTLKVTLMRHLDLHTKEIRCHYCNKTFFSEVKRSAHINHHHTPWSQKEKGAVCEVCNKAFYNNSKLKVHMRMHTGERPYACSFCEKTFQCSSHCKRHERLHTGEHPYVCETCGKGFGSPSNLKDHVYTHTKETPYKCDKCGRGFTQWGALQRHVSAIHEKKKDCKCEECGKAFARKDYLRFHIQKCHWHKCGLCKASFEDETAFQQHVKNCNVVPDVKTPSTRRNRPFSSPQRGSMSARRSETPRNKSPRKRPSSEPRLRKRPLPPDSQSSGSSRKKRQVATPTRVNTDLLSVYDQVDDDPLADPDYDAFEDLDELEADELIEEEGVQMDTEEILEQEEISQLEDMTTGNIEILGKVDNETNQSEKVDTEDEQPPAANKDEVISQNEGQEPDTENPPASVDVAEILQMAIDEGKKQQVEENTANPIQEESPVIVVEEESKTDSEQKEKENEKLPEVPQAQSESRQSENISGETTLDSLVNALVSAAELQGTVLPDKEE